jgi:hypothetical protein
MLAKFLLLQGTGFAGILGFLSTRRFYEKM